MGAEKPSLSEYSSSIPKTKKTPSLPFLIIGASLLILCALKWSDVIEYINGEPKLTAKHLKEQQKKLDEPDIAEQYALSPNFAEILRLDHSY